MKHKSLNFQARPTIQAHIQQMDMEIVDSQLMNFIRRDGLAGALICFLTIEDGGANSTEHDFFAYKGGSGVWEPGIKKRSALEMPGDCISKIMSRSYFRRQKGI